MSQNLTHEQARELIERCGAPVPEWLESPKQRLSKFGNVKKEIDGITFDSTLEADAYQIIKQWERAGEIVELKLQPEFTLQESFKDPFGKTHRAIKYRADFSFRRVGDLLRTVVDAKGMLTKEFRTKEKMFRERYPHKLEIWTRQTIKELRRG